MKTLKKLLLASLILISGTLFAAEKTSVALEGYCPVCYISAGKAVKGTTEFQANYGGKTSLFVKQEALDAFKKTPEKFLPAYDGLCAYGMAYGKKVKSDPTIFEVVNGKLYLNKNKSIGKKFAKKPNSYISKADAKWEKIEMKMKQK